ncbi:MAG: hypothetical protein ACRD1N_01885 [Terriglobia bacterium]
MKLKPGQYVRHAKYGWGTIMETRRDQTEVFFQTVGIKKFAASLANFNVVEDRNPKRKPSA